MKQNNIREISLSDLVQAREAAARIDGIADTLQCVADDLRRNQQPFHARVVEQVTLTLAEQSEKLSNALGIPEEALYSKSYKDLAQEYRDMANGVHTIVEEVDRELRAARKARRKARSKPASKPGSNGAARHA